MENGYTDTGSYGWLGDVIGKGIGAWAEVEKSNNAQETQANAYANVMRMNDAQAKAQSYTAQQGQGQMLTMLLVVGGLLVGGLVLYKVVK
jgi:hypothetical protein